MSNAPWRTQNTAALIRERQAETRKQREEREKGDTEELYQEIVALAIKTGSEDDRTTYCEYDFADTVSDELRRKTVARLGTEAGLKAIPCTPWPDRFMIQWNWE